jgi:hypothetical protein
MVTPALAIASSASPRPESPSAVHQDVVDERAHQLLVRRRLVEIG